MTTKKAQAEIKRITAEIASGAITKTQGSLVKKGLRLAIEVNKLKSSYEKLRKEGTTGPLLDQFFGGKGAK